MTTEQQKPVSNIKPITEVICKCGHKIYDGDVVRSRCVKLHEGLALCRCKEWVWVPVGYIPY